MATSAVTTAKGRNWKAERTIRQQEAWERHPAFADDLVVKGVIILGGPINSDYEDDIALLAVEAGDEQRLRAIFDADPWVANGVLRLKGVRRWTVWLDSRRQAAASR